MPGLNSKLSEVGALLALQKLIRFDDVVQHGRCWLKSIVPNCPVGLSKRCMASGMPTSLWRVAAAGLDRATALARLAAHGVGAGHYFSPHLAEQSYSGRQCQFRFANDLLMPRAWYVCRCPMS